MTSPFIRIRGARQHNLKNVDVDIPLGALTVVTGVSGSGKSSLAFDTLYAEGQRRYVETFSAYARQFLDRMDRPDVDAVEGIPPAVAIDRNNTIRSSRSTVGTLTELADHLKLLWAKTGTLHCPGCARPVRRDDAASVVKELLALPEGTKFVLWFGLEMGSGRGPEDAAADLAAAGFTRVLDGDATVDVARDGKGLPKKGKVLVVVDRLVAGRVDSKRLTDSVETAMRAGVGKLGVRVLGAPDAPGTDHLWSDGLHCPYCDRAFKDPTPNLFSFNSPIGACATCHGFGRTVGIDWDLVIPVPRRTIRGGALAPLTIPSAAKTKAQLNLWCRRNGVPTDVPWVDLPEEHRRRILRGDGEWEGMDAYFRYLESKAYKIYVRVQLSRYRGYPTCPDCGGGRLAEEGRAWKVGGRRSPRSARCRSRTRSASSTGSRSGERPAEPPPARRRESARTRAPPPARVRPRPPPPRLPFPAAADSRGGDPRRDPPAARSARRLGALLPHARPPGPHALGRRGAARAPHDRARQPPRRRALRARRAVGRPPSPRQRAPRAAFCGACATSGTRSSSSSTIPRSSAPPTTSWTWAPRPASAGGRVVAQGSPAEVLANETSVTGAFLSGRRRIARPAKRRDLSKKPRVGVKGARAHNLTGIDLLVPLGALTVLTGVSGSGKSSLAHDVFFPALARALGRAEGTPGPHDEVVGASLVSDVVLVDQSSVGRSPRANAATYVGAWDGIRAAFAKTPDARARGHDHPSSFSFNVPGGRCERCKGDGHEKVEMQFLSDVYVPCPECDGKRFRPEILEIRWKGLTISDVLGLTVTDAIERFAEHPKVRAALRPLADVGLGYLRLGQPVSTLSGGEAQRLRIAEALAERRGSKPRVYVLDEPTTGLHLADVEVLLAAIDRLVERGHAVLAVEHHLDVIAAADWVVDLGPEGGPAGGRLVAEGTPETVAAGPGHTARHLRAALEGRGDPDLEAEPALAVAAVAERAAGLAVRPVIAIEGAREHNLKDVDVDDPARRARRRDGALGLGEVHARLRHRLRRGAAPLRRVALALRAPVRGAVAPARRGPGVGDPADRLDRAAHDARLVALDGRDPDRDRALPPPPLHQDRRAPLPRLRPRARGEAARGRSSTGSSRSTAARRSASRRPWSSGARASTARSSRRRRSAGTSRCAWTGASSRRSPCRRSRAGTSTTSRRSSRRVKIEPGKRDALRAALDEALRLGKGNVVVVRKDGSGRALSTGRTCPRDGVTVPEPDPRFFSHNSPRGWCPTCKGLGTRPTIDPDLLPVDEDATLTKGGIPVLGLSHELHVSFVKDAVKTLGVTARTAWKDFDKATRRKLLLGRQGPRRRLQGRRGVSRGVPRRVPRHRDRLARRLRAARALPRLRGSSPASRGRGRARRRHDAPRAPRPLRRPLPRRRRGAASRRSRRGRRRADPARARVAHGVPRARGTRVTSRSSARRPRSPAASRSASASRPRSGARCAAPATCSTSPRSGSTCATTRSCSTRSPTCATAGTR